MTLGESFSPRMENPQGSFIPRMERPQGAFSPRMEWPLGVNLVLGWNDCRGGVR